MLSTLRAGAAGGPDALPELQIKAAYILKFARYASWPPAVLADAHTRWCCA